MTEGNKTFNLEKKLKIILYGINKYSENLYQTLDDNGYNVIAFFDNRYIELEASYPIPVYSIHDNPFEEEIKEEFCVIIMLQNAMQHDAIAKKLMKKGYSKILFVPMHNEIKESVANKMRMQYNVAMLHQFEMLKNIPKMSKEIRYNNFTLKHTLISNEGKYCIAWIPIELIYTNPSYAVKSNEALKKYANVPLIAYFPYVNLFEYLSGNQESSLQYLEEYGVNSCKYVNDFTNKDILIQRKELMDIYMESLNRGMDFFVSSAPLAEWNEKYSVFNLLEGQHRSLFLLIKGFDYIPIRICKNDLKKWNNNNSKKYMEKEVNTNSTAIRILHPICKNFNFLKAKDLLVQLQCIQKYLGSELFKLQTVLDVSMTFGYFARNAFRMHASKVFSLNEDNQYRQEMINLAENISSIQVVHGWDEIKKQKYDVIFLMNSLNNISESQKINMLSEVSILYQKKCFVCINDMDEKKVIEENLMFSHKKLLSCTTNGKSMVELYVFIK